MNVLLGSVTTVSAMLLLSTRKPPNPCNDLMLGDMFISENIGPCVISGINCGAVWEQIEYTPLSIYTGVL